MGRPGLRGDNIHSDDILEQHRSLANSAQGISGAMAQSAHEYEARLAEQQRFAQAVNLLQEQVLKDIQDQSKGVSKTFKDLIHSFEAQITSLLTGTLDKADKAHEQLDELSTVSEQDMSTCHMLTDCAENQFIIHRSGRNAQQARRNI